MKKEERPISDAEKPPAQLSSSPAACRPRWVVDLALVIIALVVLEMLLVGRPWRYILSHEDRGFNVSEHRGWAPIDDPSGLPGFPHAAVASFDIPVSAAVLSILSRGHNIGGTLEYGKHPSKSPDLKPDQVHVEIRVYYRSEEMRDRVQPCTLERDSEEYGIGLLADARGPDPNQLSFAIKVSSPSETVLRSFETDLPNFEHVIWPTSSGLSMPISFDNLVIKTTNAKIDGLIQAKKAKLVTKDAPISGTYLIHSELIAHTWNSPIDAFLHLHNDVDSKTNTLASFRTANGDVKIRSQLTKSSFGDANFAIRAQTENAKAQLFIQGASQSTIRLDVRSSNGPVDVTAPSVYEGEFDLATTHFKPNITNYDQERDGQGRWRSMVYLYEPDFEFRQRGETFKSWVAESEKWGSIHLESTNAPVSLSIGWHPEGPDV